MRTYLCSLAIAALAACPPSRPPPASVATPVIAPEATPAPLPPDVRFERDMMVRYHMHGNLDLMRAIERLLIKGKLDEARDLARAIAEGLLEPELGPWGARAALVVERAQAVADAPGVDEACRREARLAEACAGCHIDTVAQPEFGSPPAAPPDLDSVAARMARHRWAADRLWEGLIGADDASWRAGLAVLAQPPLRWPALGDRHALARSLQQLADQGRQRQTTDNLADRARLYGEMLVRCAACHTASSP